MSDDTVFFVHAFCSSAILLSYTAYLFEQLAKFRVRLLAGGSGDFCISDD